MEKYLKIFKIYKHYKCFKMKIKILKNYLKMLNFYKVIISKLKINFNK